MRYYSKVKINDFENILFSLLIKKGYSKNDITKISTENIEFSTKHFFWISVDKEKICKFYTYPSLTNIIYYIHNHHSILFSLTIFFDSFIVSLCKFGKRQLLKYCIQRQIFCHFARYCNIDNSICILYIHHIAFHLGKIDIVQYLKKHYKIRNLICTIPKPICIS